MIHTGTIMTLFTIICLAIATTGYIIYLFKLDEIARKHNLDKLLKKIDELNGTTHIYKDND